MKNYFNVTQRHLGKRAIYNYVASRKHRNGVKNTRRVFRHRHTRKVRGSMIKNTKRNANWGKVPIGVHLVI